MPLDPTISHTPSFFFSLFFFFFRWNERNAPEAYAAALRQAVAKESPETFVLDRLPHYPGTGALADPKGCSDKVWNSTDGRYWVDEEGCVRGHSTSLTHHSLRFFQLYTARPHVPST